MGIKQRYLDVADVLEKTATYVDALESRRLDVIAQEKSANAQQLAEKISQTVGEPLNSETVEKLAELSPEMSALVQRLSGGNSVDSLGGPPNVKLASAGGQHSVTAGVAAANTRFVNWVTDQ